MDNWGNWFNLANYHRLWSIAKTCDLFIIRNFSFDCFHGFCKSLGLSRDRRERNWVGLGWDNFCVLQKF